MWHGRVAGRYRLLEPVGSGGMGRVWLARDEMLQRDVAIKEVIPPGWLTDEERADLRLRTLREAQAAARLSHPHVVQTYDVVPGEARPWIVMEYIPSRSLHQMISEDGPLDPQPVAQIGLCVLAGLRAAHLVGVLHRDVKPHNVLIGRDGRVVLTDFGLATFDSGDGAATRAGLIMGSPQYVSPERARHGTSTVESDLWSLGATLYAAVEGHAPYARSSAMATLSALATDPPDPPRRAGPLRVVLNGLLRRDPRARISPEEAHSILLRIATGELRGRQWLLPRPRRAAESGNGGSARPVPPAPVPPVSASGSAPPLWIETMPPGAVDRAAALASDASQPLVVAAQSPAAVPPPVAEPPVVAAPPVLEAPVATAAPVVPAAPRSTQAHPPHPSTSARPAADPPSPAAPPATPPAQQVSAPAAAMPHGARPTAGPPATGAHPPAASTHPQATRAHPPAWRTVLERVAEARPSLEEPTTRRIPTSDPPARLRTADRGVEPGTGRHPTDRPRRWRAGALAAAAALLALAIVAALLVVTTP